MSERERYLRRKAAGYWQNLPAATRAKRKAYADAYRAKHRGEINASRRKVKTEEIIVKRTPIVAGENLRERFMSYRNQIKAT